MSDLLSIGVSGLGAYQRALSTTSNNIANLQTEGYVRQRAMLDSASQDTTSRISLGNGVRFSEVQRLYDQFAEESLQRTGSSLKSQESLLSQLQSLQDAIGSSEAGLHGAFQAFFDAARELEAAPASPGSRSGFLAAAEGIAMRMRELGRTGEDLNKQTKVQIETSVDKVNTYLNELADLNLQLAKRANDSEQPMQLLDRRDASLKGLSEEIGVTVSLSKNGSVAIYAGDSASGVALVEGGRARILSVNFDDYDYAKSEFILDAASQPTVLGGISSGLIGGLLSFRGQSLGTTIGKLDDLALAFGGAVNRVHKEGINSKGEAGQDVFYIGPDFAITGAANAGSGRLSVEVVDPKFAQAHGYQLSYDASNSRWTVKDVQTGDSASGTSPIAFQGLRFTILGESKNGDTFRVTPQMHPALTFRTLIKDGGDVASAARLMVQASGNNSGDALADVKLVSPRAAIAFRTLAELLPESTRPTEQSFELDTSKVAPRADTLVSATTKPIATIPAGYRDVSLQTSSAGGQLAVFTRDGRQLSGPAATAVVTAENGFYKGATYSNTYLNKSGSDGYFDLDFSRGMYAPSGSQVGLVSGDTLSALSLYTKDETTSDTNPTTLLSPAQIYTDEIDSSVFAAASTLTLRINGADVAVAVPASATATPEQLASAMQQLASAINAHKATTGAIVEVSGKKLIFKSYNALYDSTSKSYSPLTTNTIDGSSKIQINGVTFTTSNATPAATLAAKINAANLGVTATESAGKLTITNTEGRAGESIIIGTDSNVGITPKTYFNNASLRVGIPSTSNVSDLTKLGLKTGFVMNNPLAEDLLVFGVSSTGEASSIYLSGSYQSGAVPEELRSDEREYTVLFDSGNYVLKDVLTNTEISRGAFDLETRSVSYGNWRALFEGIPTSGDQYTIKPNTDPIGDNRIAAAMSALQQDRGLLTTGQTLQAYYEDIVNSVGARLVQTEISKDAFEVTYRHAKERRDRVSGVNLDEELAELLRFQQAYQANAQVVQVASRLFDSLMQRL